MKRSNARSITAAGLAVVAALGAWGIARGHFRRPVSFAEPGSITVDYPAEGSVFPPEFPAPTWLWRDAQDQATTWEIDITFADGAPSIRTSSKGERLRIGETDPRAVAPTNEPPTLTPQQAAAHTWTPDRATWAAMKQHSVSRPATVVIAGHRAADAKTIVSRGQVSFQTSSDPVGAPIFYRDVPLMPSENEKGVIKPLALTAVPLVAWRLRNVADRESRVVMQGLHTCANCHSFSADGKTLGLDMDGPGNDKGLYALVNVQPQMTIRNDDLIAWSTFRGKLGSKLRVGFMSQVSPDGRYVSTTVNDPGIDPSGRERRKDQPDLVRNMYVANFKDYRFLQVFYTTRGVLAWYKRDSAHLQYLPGADDAQYVQTNAVWSPDGKYLVFARAAAQDAYPAGVQLAEYANDPKETQVQFDLYRIPFNEGKGGKPEPIPGASRNGMSNSFPKLSPDGRWLVFVQARNGFLMRPDGQLYIVPANGGTARRMRCNTPLMNSWHSFSPNGRWLVFSSKSQSPYTQMFLTHIDEAGNDSPAILIENATAANRAVNIPEFVNIPADGIAKIDAPAAEYAHHMDRASELMSQQDYRAAALAWRKALDLVPADSRAHNGLGVALAQLGQLDEAMAQYREALASNPQYAEAYNNLGEALAGKGDVDEAIAQFAKAVRVAPGYPAARANLGLMLARTGRADEAVVHLRKVVADKPDAAEARRNLGHALAEKGDFQEARAQLAKADSLAGGKDPLTLHLLGRVYADLGRFAESEQAERKALAMATEQNNPVLMAAINAHLAQVLEADHRPAPARPRQGP
jgi:Flp pilus assembly protein TadD